jgi:ATP-dependent helicase/nuclease subunit A
VRDPEGRTMLVVDYKTTSLAETSLAMPTEEVGSALPTPPAQWSPREIVERDYRLQRLVYALACLRAGAEQVEVVYQFLERPDVLVTDGYNAEDAPALEAELSAAIAEIQAGEFRPTPDEFVCADCPARDLVCAGPRLRNAARPPALVR